MWCNRSNKQNQITRNVLRKRHRATCLCRHLMCSDCMVIFLFSSSSRCFCSICHSLAVLRVCSALSRISSKLLRMRNMGNFEFWRLFSMIVWRIELISLENIGKRGKRRDGKGDKVVSGGWKQVDRTYLKSVYSKSYEFWSFVKFSLFLSKSLVFPAIS